LSPTGICLFPKGKTFVSELTAAAARWQMHAESLPRQADPDAAILRIRDIQRVRHAT
jgi:16S rRNA (guanine527-N7)-methyltransferase